MSGRNYLNHGRRHRPGGSDPIPFQPDSYAPNQPMPIHTFAESGAWGQFTDIVFDATIYPGAVLRNFGGLDTAADGDFQTFHCLLGPYGSVWVVDVILERGPDYGIYVFEWGTPSEDSLVDPTQTGRMEDPSTVTYVSVPSSSQDGYVASYTPNVLVPGVSALRIGGSTGDPLTTTTTDAYTGLPLGDGGPGLYNIKAGISGKNASSSGYKGGFQALALRRIAEGFD